MRGRYAALTAVALAGALVAPANAVSTRAVSTRAVSTHTAPSGPGILTAGPKVFLRPGIAHAADATRGANTSAANPGAQQLSYGGGSAGHGVQLHPAVYLVFWGSQWSKTDPYADYERRFFKGLYGRGDDWTRIEREYCQAVAKGAVSCPRNAARIGTPPSSGGVLKGVWFDDSELAVPDDALGDTPTTDSVQMEAVRAAAHFGNVTPASNVNAQYIINEPSHFDSPGYGLYCAYHSYVQSSSYGPVVYTDLPYVTDFDTGGVEGNGSGLSCGENMVNKGAAGKYDGVSLAVGHEFVESMTDPYPSTGWVDSSGQETGDKCAYRTSGPGAMSDLHLTTGTFAVQGMWSNLAGNGNGDCITHEH